MSYKIEFVLKQHTPIIHFQSDQADAGLRATEVKPKLDRFIAEKIGRNSIPTSWIQGRKPKSNNSIQLRYKLIIKNAEMVSERIPKGDRNKAPMFFGNMGEDYEVNMKFLTWYKNKVVQCKIICLIDGNERVNGKILKEVIEEYLAEFFFRNNFGTRQSKGYGSFTCITINNNTVSYSPMGYHFTVNSVDSIKALKDIDLFYRSIRSGIQVVRNGETIFYFKSLLFLYFNQKGIKWDKRAIKENLLSWHGRVKSQKDHWNSANDSFDKKVKGDSVLARDMLGLSTPQKWSSYKKTIKKEHKPSNVQEKIDRFKSPITFKPVYFEDKNKFVVYIVVSEIPDDMYDTVFEISTDRDSFQINTPIKKHFSMQTYLDWLFKADDNGNYVNIYEMSSNVSYSVYNKLKQIFEDLRS